MLCVKAAMVSVAIHCVCTVCKVSLCSPLARGESRKCFMEYHTLSDYSQKYIKK